MTYIEVDFPIPFDLETKRLDKYRKQFTGLNYARKLNPSHIMTVDADDCVSRHLVEFVEQHPEQNGWFIDRGYVYREGRKSIFYKRKNFNQWCGTCNILRSDLHTYVESTELDFIDYRQFYTGHHRVALKMEANETPIKPLPFPGVIYIISHQDNLSNEQPKPGNSDALVKFTNPLSLCKKVLLNYRFLTLSIRDKFGLYNLSSSQKKTEDN
ncbi:glycosyltransferase family 2 protein [Lusitaniella coriacea]|uniref:glycosyltransferase family 2 protein n=1 Tax=Lusitaniella coriacea TaxID=1983105 RepID=UPI001D15D647|nr:glycosyltransferase family 2 protein [Lusitaniella coriacea]